MLLQSATRSILNVWTLLSAPLLALIRKCFSFFGPSPKYLLLVDIWGTCCNLNAMSWRLDKCLSHPHGMTTMISRYCEG